MISTLPQCLFSAGFDSVNMTIRTRDFDNLLLGSIDDALLSLGESSRQSIYLYYENKFQGNRETIPDELEHFQTALESIFGLGARFIEILIMRILYSKVGQPLDLDNKEELEFIKYIDAARKCFCDTHSHSES